MSNSTPEEQIAVLNMQKQINIVQITTLNSSIIEKENLIDNYTSAIAEFENQITSYQASITALEQNNAIIDDIITEITPPTSK